MPDDFSGVSAAFDKTTYGPGDAMKLTIAGNAVVTQQTTQPFTATIQLQAGDGSTGTATATGQLVKAVATPESVKIVSVTDDAGRTYTVDPGGLFATAAA